MIPALSLLSFLAACVPHTSPPEAAPAADPWQAERDACDGGDGAACTALAQTWQQGLVSACASGSLEACVHLEHHQVDGPGRADEETARTAWDSACASGHAVACAAVKRREASDPDAVCTHLRPALIVGASGFRFVGADRLLIPDGPCADGESCANVIPCIQDTGCFGRDDFDWAGLTGGLESIAKACPDMSSFLLIPEPEIPLVVVVETMGRVLGEGSEHPLFSNAVLAGGVL